MRNSVCFAAMLVLAVSMGSFGQYYKVLYRTTDIIWNATLHSPDSSNPFDYENDGKNELVVDHSTEPATYDILDGSTFLKKFQINGSYTYNGKTVINLPRFYGFWDIDGDNEREAVLGAYYSDSTEGSVNGLAFVNISTQTMEYFNVDVFINIAPTFTDINHDGFMELITHRGIIGHSATPESQNVQAPLPKKTSLSINAYPNPATSPIRINYNVPAPSMVTITVYNTSGRLVKQLVNGRKPVGNFTETWNGRSENGASLAPGEYYYEVKVGTMAATKTMIVVR